MIQLAGLVASVEQIRYLENIILKNKFFSKYVANKISLFAEYLPEYTLSIKLMKAGKVQLICPHGNGTDVNSSKNCYKCSGIYLDKNSVKNIQKRNVEKETNTEPDILRKIEEMSDKLHLLLQTVTSRVRNNNS